MSAQKKLLLIIDFCASNNHTHHWSYVMAYKQYCIRNKIDFQLILPAYTSAELKVLFGSNAKFILQGTEYVAPFLNSPKNFILSKLVKYLILLARCLKCETQAKILLKHLYTRKIYSEITRLSSSHSLTILFPSTDSLSVFLIEKLNLAGINSIFFAIRVIGAETRGILSSGLETKTLVDLSKKSSNINIGFEVLAQEEIFLRQGFKKSSILWAPIPKLWNRDITLYSKIKRGKPILIGFPGAAKFRKGFDDISKIMAALRKDNVYGKVVYQSALFEWETYRQSNLDILNTGFPFKQLRANLNADQFARMFKNLDVVILPYKDDEYKGAGSAVLFQAADLKIPIFLPDYLHLSLEIKKFNLGFCYKDFIKLSKELSNFTKFKFTADDFDYFTYVRENQTKIFLSN